MKYLTTKRVYKQKCFSDTIKNLNCEILTTNLVTFKNWLGLRMKNNRGSLKNPIFSERFIKNQYRFKVRLGEKEGGGDLKGGDTSMHLKHYCKKTRIKVLLIDICTSIISLSKIAHQM